jgi:hypothetical protein
MLCYPQLEHLWRERLFKSAQHAQAAVLLNRIATDMAERETLHAPAARFEAERRDLDYLVSVGILQYDEALGNISFTHQTLFDFARARAFVTQEGSLSPTSSTAGPGGRFLFLACLHAGGHGFTLRAFLRNAVICPAIPLNSSSLP